MVQSKSNSSASRTSDASWLDQRMISLYLKMMQHGLPCRDMQFNAVGRLLRANNKPVERFVDIACGDGVIGQRILDQYPNSHGIFIDFSEQMLEKAKARLEGYRHRINIIAADLCKVDWATTCGIDDASEDLVITRYAIHHLQDDKKKSLYEAIFRVLKPGGMFLNIEHVSSPTDWLNQISDDVFVDSLYEYAQKVDPACTRQQILELCSEREGEVHDEDICVSVEKQCDWLRNIGYADVDCYAKYFEFAVFGGRRPAR
ncbi:class I SAM-dependent methyltransferase [Planctomycetota bacterium]|nr:class I SAM-dependent methyltransferase [Planctomycetota bacterium]